MWRPKRFPAGAGIKGKEKGEDSIQVPLLPKIVEYALTDRRSYYYCLVFVDEVAQHTSLSPLFS